MLYPLVRMNAPRKWHIKTALKTVKVSMDATCEFWFSFFVCPGAMVSSMYD
jgi:hypothetical protein